MVIMKKHTAKLNRDTEDVIKNQTEIRNDKCNMWNGKKITGEA